MPKPLSRRSLLGLGAIAGAGAGAIVAGGINAGRDSSTSSVVDVHGVPLVTANPQQLSATQQQQAARNIGAVRTIEPEQFDGSSDDEQLSAAFASLRETGGEIRLRPGKAYTWLRSPRTVDWAQHGAVVLTAWGASVTYAGQGTAFTSMQSDTQAGIRTLTVFGGEWIAPHADTFFKIQDSGNHLFYRCRGDVPGGTFFALSNVHFYSERNHFVEIDDHGCREVIRFSIDGSSHSSFARTLVRDLRVQGGVSGYAKLNVITGSGNVQPAPYDSTYDGITGNIFDGVVVARLAGQMSGTRLARFQIESQPGSKNAAYFDVGPLSGKPPSLVDGPPVLRHVKLFTDASPPSTPFGPIVATAGLTSSGAMTGAPYLVELTAAGAITVPAALCNVAIVTLGAPCTGGTIDVLSNQNPGATQTVPETTQQMTLVFVQGGAGGFAYTWPNNCRFAKGTPPTDTTPGTQTSATFIFSGGLWLETARAEGVPIS